MEGKAINPWRDIWTEPRKTMRSILSTNPNQMVLLLAIVAGILSAVSLYFAYRSDPALHRFFVLGLIGAVIGGAIGGIIHLYFTGWLYRLTGSWLGGKGSFTDLKSAVGWSNYPFIITSILSILGVFAKNYPIVVAILGVLNFILLIWGIVIFFKLIAEAHQFTVWKGILAVLIAFVLIFVVVMIIALLVPLLRPLFQ